jgi:hypothetical protein
MLSAKPARTEPATKMTMLACTRIFLSNRSASLPQIGVVAALASSAAVMTHAKSVWEPLRSLMMVGRALATMVLLRIAVNRPASRPVSACRICAWLMGSPAPLGAAAGCGSATAAAVALVDRVAISVLPS